MHFGRCENLCESREEKSDRFGRRETGIADDDGENVHLATTPRSECLATHVLVNELATNIHCEFLFLIMQVLLELARSKNMAALPLIKPHCGLRLPPDRHCLLSANYKLRAAEIQPKKMTKSALDRSSGKNKSTGATILKRQSVATIPKTQTVTIPKPVFKFSGNSNAKSTAGTTTTPSSASAPSALPKVVPPSSAAPAAAPSKSVEDVKMELDEEYNSSDSKGLKRKHEDDDEFEMVE